MTKLGRLIEQGCFKFTNLTNYHFYVNVPTCTWMRGEDACFCAPVTNPATIYIEIQGFNDFKDPYLMRKFGDALYAWSYEKHAWGRARMPGCPIGKEACKKSVTAVLFVHPAKLFANNKQYCMAFNDRLNSMRDYSRFNLAFTSMDQRDVVALFGDPHPLDAGALRWTLPTR